LAFTTVTGSNGITSLVGTTGRDIATLVTLDKDVFIGGNTGSDTVTLALGTGSNNASNYNVRMGGGTDTFTQTDTLLNSFVSLDGETLGNDDADVFVGGGAGNLIINSEIVGRGGNDTIGQTNALLLSNSSVNGNTGNDIINVGTSSSSFVYGGQNSDTITITGTNTDMYINGNKGVDTITAAGTFRGTIYGGQGGDNISLTSTTDGIVINGDLGNDNITGAAGDDTVNGGDDSDVISTSLV